MSCSFAWENRKKANPAGKKNFHRCPCPILRSLGVRKKRIKNSVWAPKNFRWDSLLPGFVARFLVAVVLVVVVGMR